MLPNPPIDRLKFIDKQYGEKYPAVVYYMVDIIAHTVGEDRWKQAVVAAVGRTVAESSSDKDQAEAEAAQRTFERTLVPTDSVFRIEPSVLKAALSLILPMVSELAGFKRPHPADGAFPWMAKQLADALRELLKLPEEGRLESMRFQEMARRFLFFKRSGTAIGQWLRDERPNLNSMSFGEVKEAVEDFGVSSGPVPQGEVVLKMSDGWTAQKLTTKEQLDAEGAVMQHCVGSYFAKVQKGNSEIFSLRDKHGRPHVTVEFNRAVQRIVQVRGKQNAKPDEKYKKYVDEFLATMPKLPAHIQAIADVLENEFGGNFDDEEEIEYRATDWANEGFGAEDVTAWARAGLSYDNAEIAGALQREDVEPNEYLSFPWAVRRRIEETGDADDMVALGRVAVQIREADTKLAAAPLPKQAEMFSEAWSYEDTRDRNDVFLKRKKGPLWRYVEFDLDRPDSLDHLIFPAEDWLATGQIDAKPAGKHDDVREWILAGFNPKTAGPWWDTGRDGFINPKAARALITRGYKASDFADVEVDDSMDVDDLIEALEKHRAALNANRRRRR